MYPIALLITATLAVSGVLGQNSTVQCAQGLKMFVSRGTSEPAGPGATGALVDVIASRINGSDIQAIEYPASMEDPLYFTSVANGTAQVKEAITTYAAACPGSKMAVFGYSQGAQITSNAFCGTPPAIAAFAVPTVPEILAFAQPLPANVTKDVISVVVFGDPVHRHDAPYNYGNSTGNGVFWRHDISACEALGRRIRAYCDEGDQFCSVGPVVDAYTHGLYLERYGSDVVQYVVGQYNGGGGASNGSDVPGPSPTFGPIVVSESGRHSVMVALVVTGALLVLGLI